MIKKSKIGKVVWYAYKLDDKWHVAKSKIKKVINCKQSAILENGEEHFTFDLFTSKNSAENWVVNHIRDQIQMLYLDKYDIEDEISDLKDQVEEFNYED